MSLITLVAYSYVFWLFMVSRIAYIEVTQTTQIKGNALKL